MSEQQNEFSPKQNRPAIAALKYTLRRISLLFAFAAIFYLLGIQGLMMWLLAFGLSGIVALTALRQDRDQMSVGIAGLVNRFNQRIEDSKRSEDLD